jgi:hypothetical protein
MIEKRWQDKPSVWFQDYTIAVVTATLLYIRCQDTPSEDWEELAYPSDL